MAHLSCIVAMTPDRVIGRDGNMPWGKLPSDLIRFRDLTKGKPVIMGRKTFDSIVARNGRPLPGRKNIVLTRQASGSLQQEGVYEAHSPEAALSLSKGAEEMFVIGGAQIYDMFLPRIEYLYITYVHTKRLGDTIFPTIEEYEWEEECSLRRGLHDRGDSYLTSFHLFKRR